MSHFHKEFCVIYIRVVQGCNLNCSHCFTLGNRDPYRLAPLEQIESFLEAIKLNVSPKKAVFYIHGGETFLAPLKYLRQVNELIRNIFSGIEFNIIPQTNLMYDIKSEFIEFIKQEHKGHLGVSWDNKIRFETGSKKLSEELFFANFNQLTRSGIELAVAITVHKYLFEIPATKLLQKFDGAKSIDFEFLTMFDEKTLNLRASNETWSNYLLQIAEYYAHNETTWSLPQVDLFTKSFLSNSIYQCKCNCCEHRTFTMNVNGSVGLCPDDSYINPLSTVEEMVSNWKQFESKAMHKYANQISAPIPEICQSCTFFDYCGGNCEPSLFSKDEADCPMSLKTLSYQFKELDVFKLKLKSAYTNLIELRKD